MKHSTPNVRLFLCKLPEGADYSQHREPPTLCQLQEDKMPYDCTSAGYSEYSDSRRQKLKHWLAGAWSRRAGEFWFMGRK